MGDVITLSQSPLVSDIPGQLRQMAEMIESGEMEARSALFIIPREGDLPDIFGWGDHLGDYGNIAVCELAKAFFVNHATTR